MASNPIKGVTVEPTRYPILFEVAGPLGMFADPASGGDAHSYPVPPPSACTGMLASVDYCHGVIVEIAAVGVCCNPRWTPYSFTTMSSYRKPEQISKGAPYLGRENVLVEPTFQILACLSNAPNWQSKPVGRTGTTNPAHLMHDHFYRRLRYGRSFRPVCLGRKEMLAAYVGAPRTPVNRSFNTVINAMSSPTFDSRGRFSAPTFKLMVHGGIAQFSPHDRLAAEVVNGALTFKDANLRTALANATK